MSTVGFHRLGHDRAARELHADACELGFSPGVEPFTFFDTVPGGPRAPGVEVRNRRTGNVARFILSARERNAEGELLTWRFTPHPASVAQHPNLDGYTLVVFND